MQKLIKARAPKGVQASKRGLKPFSGACSWFSSQRGRAGEGAMCLRRERLAHEKTSQQMVHPEIAFPDL